MNDSQILIYYKPVKNEENPEPREVKITDKDNISKIKNVLNSLGKMGKCIELRELELYENRRIWIDDILKICVNKKLDDKSLQDDIKKNYKIHYE